MDLKKVSKKEVRKKFRLNFGNSEGSAGAEGVVSSVGSVDPWKMPFLPSLVWHELLSYCDKGTIMKLYEIFGDVRRVVEENCRQVSGLDVYPKQWKAAREVVGEFLNGMRYVLLTAQPQSGKSGTCQAVCYLVRQYRERLKIDNFWFICGMNDNELKSQQMGQFRGLIPEKQVLFSKDLQSWVDLSRGVKGVEGGREGEKLGELAFRNSLIILDESHYAQCGMEYKSTHSSMVHKFLTGCVGIGLDGDNSKWRRENVWFLSVSATPMSELAHFLGMGRLAKGKVLLEADRGYYGYERMFEVGKVKKAFRIGDSDDRDKFAEVLRREYCRQVSEGGTWKYVIIRFSNTGQGEEYRRELMELVDFPFDYLHFHSKFTKVRNINKVVGEVPKKMTIIGIYHSLRAGIQLDTRNICLVHETPGARTDVTAQGLPGRCCGYGKESHGVEIYGNKGGLEDYLQLIQEEFSPDFIPGRCFNIKKGWVSDPTVKFRANVPMAGELPDGLVGELLAYRKKNPKRYPEFLEKFGEKIMELDFVNWEIWNRSRLVGVTILDENNKIEGRSNTWVKFWEPAVRAWKKGREGAYFKHCELDEDWDDFMYIYINLKMVHEEFGWMLVCSQKRLGEAPEDYIETTGKEQFHPRNNEGEQIGWGSWKMEGMRKIILKKPIRMKET